MADATLPEARNYKRLLGIMFALALLAIVMLMACLWAKHLVTWAAVNKGLGKPTGGRFALICAGVAYSAPVYSAFLIALARISLNRRLILGVGWFAAVMIAFSIGNAADPELGRPMMFSQDLLYSLPVVSLGWLLPFVYLHWFRGWTISLPGSARPKGGEAVTISTLLVLTALVAICFFSLQFASPRYITIALVGMVSTAVLGAGLAFAIWLLMSVRISVLWLILGGIAFYHLLSLAFFTGGAGNLAFGNATIVTAVLLSSLMGFVVLRLAGCSLETSRTNPAG